MDWAEALSLADPQATIRQMEKLVAGKLAQLERDGVLIGCSGGLDSTVAAYVSVHSVGADKVTLLYLPDKDSKARHRRDAERVADELGVALLIRDVTPILSAAGVYAALPLKYLPGRRLKAWAVRLGKRLEFGRQEDLLLLAKRLRPPTGSLIARGNAYASAKHRLRMVVLYHQAEIANLMVVGAANKTEWLTGTFCQWGCDQCADVMPLIHLYRSQLETIAEILGVPASIRNKPADPDVLPGVDDKGELLGSFRVVDQILWGLENGVAADTLVQRFGEESVERVMSLREHSCHMRKSPYTITGHPGVSCPGREPTCCPEKGLPGAKS